MPLFEKASSLATSKLWNLLSDLYEKEAINSWQQVGVPFYLTSTPKLAYQWAQLCLEFFLELKQKYPQYGTKEHPWIIMEIGSGAGRFAYLFLKTFESLLLERTEGSQIFWKYLMLDISQPVVDSWKNHPQLFSYWEKGHLISSKFDLSSDKPLTFLNANQTKKAFFEYPCAVLAGYLFDTLPAHAFSVEPGQTEGLGIEVSSTQMPEEKGSVEFLKNMQYSFFESEEALKQIMETASSKGYLEPLTRLMSYYEENLELGQSWTLSTGALNCLLWVKSISPKGFLSLTGDQGMSDIAMLKDYPRIVLGRHGSISCPVNYHGLGFILEALGEKAVLSHYGSHKFITMAAFTEEAKECVLTQEMTQRLFNEFDNVNYWQLINHILKFPSLDLELIELSLKIGHWDPINFFHLMPTWKILVAKARDFQKERWREFLNEIEENFFPIAKEEAALLNELGVCFSLLGDWPGAKKVWERALAFHQELAPVWLNLAIACMHEGSEDLAQTYFLKAEALCPELTDKLPLG